MGTARGWVWRVGMVHGWVWLMPHCCRSAAEYMYLLTLTCWVFFCFTDSDEPCGLLKCIASCFDDVVSLTVSVPLDCHVTVHCKTLDHHVASFPGPAQLSVTCSMEFFIRTRGEPGNKANHHGSWQDLFATFRSLSGTLCSSSGNCHSVIK